CSRGLSALGDSERVLTAQLDVTDASAIAVFAAKTFQRFGHVDLWINNAGLLEPIGPLRDSDSAALQRLLEVNVLGVAHGCRAYVRELRQRGAHGTVINLSSGAARTPFYGWSMYCASKAAVDRLSETLALEEAPGLRVYSIAPGVIDTEMQAA